MKLIQFGGVHGRVEIVPPKDLVKIGRFIPISDTILDDLPALPYKTVWEDYLRAQTRTFTADAFGETWNSVEDEMERLELGDTVAWDRNPVRTCDCCSECGCDERCPIHGEDR